MFFYKWSTFIPILQIVSNRYRSIDIYVITILLVSKSWIKFWSKRYTTLHMYNKYSYVNTSFCNLPLSSVILDESNFKNSVSSERGFILVINGRNVGLFNHFAVFTFGTIRTTFYLIVFIVFQFKHASAIDLFIFM